jgi:hypothetical protein
VSKADPTPKTELLFGFESMHDGVGREVEVYMGKSPSGVFYFEMRHIKDGVHQTSEFVVEHNQPMVFQALCSLYNSLSGGEAPTIRKV